MSNPAGSIAAASTRRKILIVVSEFGYWGEELVGPVEEFDRVGYESVFATPTGKRPEFIPASADATYIDPALGRPVTSAEMAASVLALAASPRLDKPVDLSSLLPVRPYVSVPQWSLTTEVYYHQRSIAWAGLKQYDALLLVGGSGPCVDMVNNGRIHDLILGFLEADKPIAAECYAVGCLAFARDLEYRQSILSGKRVTGHCIEYDYKSDWGFLNKEGYVAGASPYPLEYILRDAVTPDGYFIGNFGRATSTIVDWPFLTGRSTSDGHLVGKRLIDMLDHELLRWGW